MKHGGLALIILGVVAPSLASTEHFPRPRSIEPQVRFWKAIFTEYSQDQVVVHDAVDLDKVYRVLDYRGLRANGTSEITIERARDEGTREAVEEVRAALRALDANGGRPVNEQQRRIVALFQNDRRPGRFREASERVRSQRGIRERFREGLRISRYYLPEMEQIFRAEGLPVELTRLPLIESCFDVRAYSKVGAAGVWQFMPTTARRFMTVSSLVDERLDPLTATRGAARFLRENYETLGTWPLAITAYNHGPYGMLRAVQAVGTRDIGRIIARYQGKAFGFSSRNFYPEFLAAVEIEREAERYFGPLTPPDIPESTEAYLSAPVGIEVAARLASTDRDTLALLNPALLPPVTRGRYDIPRGYRLRVPAPAASAFEARLAALAAERRVTSSRPAPPNEPAPGTTVARHRVKRGDTLSGIAQRYGVTVAALRQANGMRGTVVRIGQTLRIPATRSASSRTASARETTPARSHRVQPGQTLTHIARRYGVSLERLRAANGLGNTSLLRAGQVLRIPHGG
ncbi:MAG TPA: LysM peptidoglycan-binding domain-containing protein [Candidatus Limnocylindria bacterium]|nr:LysM peptidoglycan-binding domain-containing protein [Candidatus Limnocylindria bacterium]